MSVWCAYVRFLFRIECLCLTLQHVTLVVLIVCGLQTPWLLKTVPRPRVVVTWVKLGS